MYKVSALGGSIIFAPDVQREREGAENMNPSYLCGFCKSPLKTFTCKKTPWMEYVVCSNEEEEEKKCPLFVKSSLLKNYCFALLYAVKKIYKENHFANTATLPRSTSADPRPTSVELSSNAPTALATIPAPISSGPMRNPSSSPFH